MPQSSTTRRTTTSITSSSSSVPWLISVGIAILAVSYAILLQHAQPELNMSKVLAEANQFMQLDASSSPTRTMPTTTASSSETKPLIGLTVAVTGATSGIGLELSRKLFEMGAHVIALGRSPTKLERLEEELNATASFVIASGKISTILADFEDLQSVSLAADSILKRFSTLDILVNNAGIHRGFNGIFEPRVTPQGYDQVFVGTSS